MFPPLVKCLGKDTPGNPHAFMSGEGYGTCNICGGWPFNLKPANISNFPDKFSRKEVFKFPEGSVTIEVNETEPALNVRTAIYFLSNVMHQIHRSMEQN
jgi:hypothetical protein